MNQGRYSRRGRSSVHDFFAAMTVFAFLFCFASSAASAQGQVVVVPESTEESGVEIIVERPPEYRYLDVIDALDESGYQILSTSRTLLNRVRIRASNGVHLREIIISRASGAILRDAILEHIR